MFPPKRELGYTLSNWRKVISIVAKTLTGSDNGKSRGKSERISNCKVINARQLAQLLKTLRQKVQVNPKA